MNVRVVNLTYYKC